MSLPLISCVMPTMKGREAFVKLAIDCFNAQDYPNKSLIIVPDGIDGKCSTGMKRQIGLKLSRGDIVCHWDDDDYHGPTRLSHQVAPILTGQFDCTGMQNEHTMSSDGRFYWMTPEFHACTFVADILPGTFMFRKEIVGKVMYPNESLSEDGAFIRQLMSNGKRLKIVSNDDKYVYIRHANNTWKFESFGRGWVESEGMPSFWSDELTQKYLTAARK